MLNLCKLYFGDSLVQTIRFWDPAAGSDRVYIVFAKSQVLHPGVPPAPRNLNPIVIGGPKILQALPLWLLLLLLLIAIVVNCLLTSLILIRCVPVVLKHTLWCPRLVGVLLLPSFILVLLRCINRLRSRHVVAGSLPDSRSRWPWGAKYVKVLFAHIKSKLNYGIVIVK